MRKDDNDWEFWPVARYFTSQNPNALRQIQLPDIGKFFYNFVVNEAKQFLKKKKKN